MRRNAKLFYLNNKDYSYIKEIIEFDADAVFLIDKIAVFNRTANLSDNSYLIISIDNKIDKIIIEHGGKEAPQNDVYKSIVKNGKNQGHFILGNEELTNFLE